MANFDSQAAGSALFSGSETFMTDLSQEDESMIAGGTYNNKNESSKSEKSKSEKSEKYCY